MNLIAMKFPFFLVLILLLSTCVWAQVEELPEDTVENSPYEKSADCDAYKAALGAVPPKFERPEKDRAYK